MKLEISKLTKTFGPQKAISSMDLVLPDCQSLLFIGPSGSGKSTLLRLLAGLEYPNSGTMTINDQPIVYEEEALRKYRSSLGIVFQSWNLFPHLTALENIVLPLHRVHGLSKEEAIARSLELLRRFGLEKHAHKKPYALSGGQVQRIALIRAVSIQPKMLMLDEPTSALDPLMTAEVLDLIMELKKDEKDFVLVTHHLQFARKVADWVLFIAEGQIIEHGTPDSLFNHPKSPLVKEYMEKVLAY
ncbi:MAG: amino acid ABC transporter ATP-binding protein [Parachlamydiales bacterium]|jgi:polar amino acid transport system ATP-binding protein